MWHEKYVGLPFKTKGRDVSGVDCYGLVRLVFKQEHNIEMPSYVEDYKNTVDGETIQSLLSEHALEWFPIEHPNERDFDVVIMRSIFRDNNKLRTAEMHLGIICHYGMLLHVESGIDAVAINYRQDLFLKKRFVQIYRHRTLL